MTLTARRLDIYQQEFDLLYYSLSSARIFFQKEKSVQDEEAVKAEAGSGHNLKLCLSDNDQGHAL